MVRARLVKSLSDNDLPLFATLDAARAEAIPEVLQAAGVEFVSLYEGASAVELQDVAPYIISITRASAFLDTLLDRGWGHAWGCYFVSDLPLDKVRHHLRKFLNVRVDAGQNKYFRFYDPRVLRAFLPTCTGEQAQEFFGCIQAFWVEAEDPEKCIVFRRGTTGVEMTVIDLAG